MIRILLALCAVFLAACGGSGGGVTPVAQCDKRAPPLSDKPVIIAYGDSTMARQEGMLRDALTAKGWALEFDNRAVSGSTLAHALNGICGSPPLAKELAGEPLAKFVLENFGLRESNATTYKANLRRFITVVKAAHMTPVIITPVHVLDASSVSQASLATMAQMGRDVVAEEGGALLIDVYELPAVTTDFAGDLISPTPAFNKRIAEYQADHLITFFQEP
jgi:hypothetical protein